MTTVGVLLLTSSCLYAGFQWTIRILVYPQFAAVPAERFEAYERDHQRRVSVAVGPLFVFFGASAVAALAVRVDAASVTAAACLALILLVTGLAAVPQHRRLTDGFDAGVLRRLLTVDSVRLALALLGCLAAARYALTG